MGLRVVDGRIGYILGRRGLFDRCRRSRRRMMRPWLGFFLDWGWGGVVKGFGVGWCDWGDWRVIRKVEMELNRVGLERVSGEGMDLEEL